jgi:HPt (histidine-containing phosphotransfer) domain-containing protein
MLDEIREALRTRDPKLLKRATHTLKGSVGNFAVSGPCETAQRLESLAKSGELSGTDDIFNALEQQLAPFNQILARRAAEPAHQPR